LALELARQNLDARRHETTPSGFKLGLLDVLRRSLDQVSEITVYVASFSENGDQLSQWRGYSHGISGYSIGITPHDLLNASANGLTLAKCIYGEKGQTELIETIIDNLFAFATTLWEQKPKEQDRVYRESYKLFASLLSTAAPLIKDSSFSEEAEWRLFSQPTMFDPTQLKFRPGRSMPIPYCEFPLSNLKEALKFKEVIIGPTPHPQLAQQAVEALFLNQRVNCNCIRNSVIPYRDW